MNDNELILSKEKGIIATMKDKELSDIIKPLTSEIHLFDTFVSGLMAQKDKTALSGIKVGDRLLLMREVNKFDDNAILIQNEQKQKLGYIPESDNVIFARLMDAGKMLEARVKKIGGNADFPQITIGIFLVDF